MANGKTETVPAARLIVAGGVAGVLAGASRYT